MGEETEGVLLTELDVQDWRGQLAYLADMNNSSAMPWAGKTERLFKAIFRFAGAVSGILLESCEGEVESYKGYVYHFLRTAKSIFADILT